MVPLFRGDFASEFCMNGAFLYPEIVYKQNLNSWWLTNCVAICSFVVFFVYKNSLLVMSGFIKKNLRGILLTVWPYCAAIKQIEIVL